MEVLRLGRDERLHAKGLIENPVALVNTSANPEAAQAFIDFRSSEARKQVREELDTLEQQLASVTAPGERSLRRSIQGRLEAGLDELTLTDELGLEAVIEVSRYLSSIRSLNELLEKILVSVVRVMGAEGMTLLVEDLLLLARLDEAPGAQLDRAPMDLRTLAIDARHDLCALDPTRPVELTGPGGDGPPGPAPVHADEDRLRQVVANLVGNAATYTPPGTGVRIGVGTVDGRAVLDVADEGPGLTAEQATRVFDRFYRTDHSRNRTGSANAGLGLAIARSLARAHDGDVELDTALGRGARFRLTLPVAE